MTDDYHANEYEDEYEDERYGPAEREREFSLHTEVPSKLSVIHEGVVQRKSLIYLHYLFIDICLPSLEFTRERTERRAGPIGDGECMLDIRAHNVLNTN